MPFVRFWEFEGQIISIVSHIWTKESPFVDEKNQRASPDRHGGSPQKEGGIPQVKPQAWQSCPAAKAFGVQNRKRKSREGKRRQVRRLTWDRTNVWGRAIVFARHGPSQCPARDVIF